MCLFLLHGKIRWVIFKSQVIAHIKVYDMLYPKTVADPGFDLGAWTFSTGVGGVENH